MLSITIKSIMLNVIIMAEYRYTINRYAECRGATQIPGACFIKKLRS
jgi:hypothetical protein